MSSTLKEDNFQEMWEEQAEKASLEKEEKTVSG